MKAIKRNTINFRGDVVEIITPNYSPFVVTVKEGGVTINHGETIIAQKHVHAIGCDVEFARQVALDTAYREAMLWLLLNDRFAVQALYRHLVRMTSDGLLEPEMLNQVSEQVAAILKMTTKANDVAFRIVGDTELNDKTQKEFTLCLLNNGQIFTHDGNSYQLEMMSILSGLEMLTPYTPDENE